MTISLEQRIKHFSKGVVDSGVFLNMVKEAKESRRFSDLSALVVDATGKGEWDVFRFLQKHVLHLGAVSVATLLKEYGFREVKAIYEVLTPDYPYKKENPDLAGVSAIMSNVPFANKRIEEFRKIWPDALIVAGGSGYAFNPDIAIRHGADACIVGKAEYPLLELLNRTASARMPGESLREAFLNSNAGEVRGVFNADNFEWIKGLGKVSSQMVGFAQMVGDLDAVPPIDYSLIQGEQSKRSRTIRESEGCPGSCDFCSAVKLNANKYRTCGADSIVKSMRDAKREGIRQVFLNGDDPLARPYHKIEELCDMISGENLGVTWVTQARICDIYNNLEKGILEKLERAGCSMLAIGVESINDSDLKSMSASGKNSYEMSEAVFGALEKSPIEIHAMLILKPLVKPGYGGILPFSAEDSERGIAAQREEVRYMVDFLKRHEARTMQLLSAVPMPGTEYPRKYQDAGIMLKRVGDKQIGLEDYTGQRVIASSNPLESYRMLLGAYRDFYGVFEIVRAVFAEPPKKRWKRASYKSVGATITYVCSHTRSAKKYLKALERGDFEFYGRGEKLIFD